eukprot:CAMPEP_0201581774 /NCGR_PEP_ID=MMETSP0190_2-20130828/75298_1 /ASSEMBLY_ACC=CAM_ASM_000263 /TAXON_ID=37353 /ORGANISM="Rosalina sp." /LENGTH=158 /DNA_ID=CAMNT_0048020433 /DNA_START=183 /DNA_END=659 /DNA_ORIENTATION=-
MNDDDYCITSGQPWDGVTSSNNDAKDRGVIEVKAGRKGSKDVAKWFREQLDGGQSLGINSGGGSSSQPEKLNFAFKGTMSFTVGTNKYSADCVMGQGHYAFNNNWWIGGKAWSSTSVNWLAGAINTSSTGIHGSQIIICGYTFGAHADEWSLQVTTVK